MEGYYSKVERLCQACRVASLAQDEPGESGRKILVVDDAYAEGYEPKVLG